MNNKTLAIVNLAALALIYLSFVPYNGQIAQALILIVAIALLLQK